MIWTGESRTVATVAEVDIALDGIAAQAADAVRSFVVTVLPAGSEHLSSFDEDFPDCLEVGLGHPDRAFVRWMGDGGGYGYKPYREPGPTELRFDYGGHPVYPEPNELRVSPIHARRAGTEFIATCKRPTHLHWQPAE
ncbi:Imm1 family immunity protein [Micromonospora sp. NPDC005215]|uniref:Imm1 family immunity protein n=1 Tax=Micromonospora sp. NPDC005215 TaxID=3157024 RepID=UPI0033A8A443